MDPRKLVPWWMKIVLKLILSRLPVSYKTWQKIGIFRHGLMDEPEYAFNTFTRHYSSVDFENKGNGFVMLELGPGDSIASGIVAHCYGAKKSYLVDKGNDAIVSFEKYSKLLSYLGRKFDDEQLPNRQISPANITTDWNIEYLMDGLDSLKKIPDASVDYLWTQSVLEHIRKDDFEVYIQQFRRIISANGVSVHGVDLKDHMSYAHNNLRFSEQLWESDFMASSGFYTNRILYSEMLDIFRRNGFQADVLKTERWDEMPTPRESLHEKFTTLSDDDLLISDFDVVLRPVQA